MKKLKLLDTFAGIGGFSYAAEKLVGGFQTVQFIEIDPYCQQVLNKNFPNIPIHDDITTYRAEPHSADIITGGFPCTDISQAGRREGITETTRSGLWFQLIRTIRMVRPKYFILENVSAILANGMDIVLRDIYEAGYDAEWCCIPSSFVGACHQRDRWWLIGYPTNTDKRSCSSQEQCSTLNRQDERLRSDNENLRDSTNSKSKRTWKDESRLWGQSQGGDLQTDRDSNKKISNASNSDSNRLQREVGSRVYRPTWKTQNIRRLNPNWRQYISQPTIRRGDDGLSNKLDASQRIQRLKQLGNTIVPAVAAIPLQRVIQLEREQQ